MTKLRDFCEFDLNQADFHLWLFRELILNVFHQKIKEREKHMVCESVQRTKEMNECPGDTEEKSPKILC